MEQYLFKVFEVSNRDDDKRAKYAEWFKIYRSQIFAF